MNRFGIGVRIAGYDVAPWVLEGGSIDYGRTTINEQPGAPTCRLTLFTREGWPQNPDAWFDYGVGTWGDTSGFDPTHDTTDDYIGPRTPLFIGAPVWVSATTTSGFLPDHDTQDTYLGAEFRRFTGRVQAIEYSRYRVDVVCAGTLEDWARVGILAEPVDGIGSERDNVRADTLATLTPSPTELHVSPVELTGILMLPVPADAYPLCLLVELQQLAMDSDSLLYQNREGNVIYQHRSWSPPWEYTIPSYVVNADALDMVLELGDMQNTVTVEYGTPDEVTGYRPISTWTDSTSIALYGQRNGYYTPPIENSTSADAHAATILNRLNPAWHLPDVELIMELATDRDVYDICALDQNFPVTIEDFPLGAPAPEFVGTVLGWTEDLSSHDWVITMHLAPSYTIAPVWEGT